MKHEYRVTWYTEVNSILGIAHFKSHLHVIATSAREALDLAEAEIAQKKALADDPDKILLTEVTEVSLTKEDVK